MQLVIESTNPKIRYNNRFIFIVACVTGNVILILKIDVFHSEFDLPPNSFTSSQSNTICKPLANRSRSILSKVTASNLNEMCTEIFLFFYGKNNNFT